MDQVLPGQWTAELLHLTALVQAAEVDGVETGVSEQLVDLGLGLSVVTGHEHHALAARLARIGGEQLGYPELVNRRPAVIW